MTCFRSSHHVDGAHLISKVPEGDHVYISESAGKYLSPPPTVNYGRYLKIQWPWSTAAPYYTYYLKIIKLYAVTTCSQIADVG